jgi:hypothetical protein
LFDEAGLSVVSSSSQHLQELFVETKPFDLMQNMSTSKSCGEGN